MTARRLVFVFLLAGMLPAPAQVSGPGLPGVGASLIRMFGSNTAFTAQVEVQVLGKDNKERIGMPMNFARHGNKIRVEVDMARMRNREQPDAIEQIKPLGLDQVVSIMRPDQRASLIVFPKLRSVVKLEMPAEEVDAFLKPAKATRTVVGSEKMEGHECVKHRVTFTDSQGKKHEATTWNAPALRDFPVCVATREGTDTVVMRFRQVQFILPDAPKFEPPAGYIECADMQVLMAGPVVKYMAANPAKKPVPAKSTAPATKAKSTPSSKTKTK